MNPEQTSSRADRSVIVRVLLAIGFTVLVVTAIAAQSETSASIPKHEQITSQQQTTQRTTAEWGPLTRRSFCVGHLQETAIRLSQDDTTDPMSNLVSKDAVSNQMKDDTNEKSALKPTQEDLRYFANGAHKKILLDSKIILLYPDNTVITANQDDCRVHALFQPTPDGNLHPQIASDVQQNMHVAQDSKGPKVPRNIPCVSPRFAKFLAGAMYASNPESIMQKVCSTCKLISSNSYNNLKGGAFLDASGNLFVSFRGTSDVGSFLTSVFTVKKALKSHQKWIDRIKKVYGDPYMIAGHSSGGHFATYISAGDPWRATFEGYKIRDGSKTINIISKYFSLADPKNKAFTYNTAGHALSAFTNFARKFTTVKSWGSAISKLKKKSCSPVLLQGTYLGCRADARRRTLPVKHKRDKMNFWVCRNLCRKYKYFGMEHGKECFCGNKLRRNTRSSKCTTRCPGNKSRLCGGKWALTMYKR